MSRKKAKRGLPRTGPRCPKCGRPSPEPPPGATVFFCDHCRMQFDDEPTEGGSFFTDPTRRAELADERKR